MSSYQPFLIGDGQAKTGYFTYLESWAKPVDAYDVLEDAFIYRGSLNKRPGYTPYPGGGYLRYRDYVTGDVGDGGSVYSGSLTNVPLVSGSVVVTVLTSSGMEEYTDNGAGVLTGDLLGTGTINYITGAWTINTGANTVSVGDPIIVGYTYIPVNLASPINRPIMAIKNHIDETVNVSTLLVCDTRRASVYNSTTLMFDPVSSISGILWVGDGTNTAISLSTGFINLVPYSVTVSDGVNSMTDDGTGGFPGAGNMLNTSAVNYATGVITINITTANTRTYTVTSNLAGDYFTGTDANFFNATNWRPNDQAIAYLYLTNNVDRITLFDGVNLTRPGYFINYANSFTYVNQIATCLDLKVYKNSLLVIRPTLVGANSPEAQTIRYSKQFIPQNLIADVTGNGGSVVAPTGDWIMSSQFLRDALIVFFQQSTWIFRFQGSSFDPFRWDKLNNTRNTNAPYASVEYDVQCSSMGAKGLIYCDGVNVDRYDINIIDQFLQIEPKAFEKCFAQRFDSPNQTWMLYPSVGDADAGNVQVTSSRVLIYNFLENTWAVFRLPMSCLGLGSTTTDLTWADFAPGSSSVAAGKTWEEWDYAWISYLNLALQPALLGGSHDGYVYQMYTTENDNGEPIFTNITTKKLNPFVGQAVKTSFGYLDVYYEVAPEVVLTFSFSANNSTDYQLIRNMTLDGSPNNSYAWKRVYLNITGEFLQINITDNGSSTFKILGMILHAAPAGRLTPGTFL